MAVASYSPRQLEALAWLPADGSSRGKAPPEMMAVLVGLNFRLLLDRCENPSEYWLTPSGIAERARLVEIGAIK